MLASIKTNRVLVDTCFLESKLGWTLGSAYCWFTNALLADLRALGETLVDFKRSLEAVSEWGVS